MHTNTHHHANMPELFGSRGSRVYDRVARWLLRGLYARIAEDAADVAPDGGAVLDVGTGPGVLVAETARRRSDLHLTGVDLSEDMVAAAARNLGPFGARASARVGDVTDLPFADDSFDMVVSSFSLHHWDDPAGAVPELARVLKPGGRLAVYDFRAAPFGMLVAEARARGLFTGRPARRDLIRTGVPLLPHCARHVMTAGPA